MGSLSIIFDDATPQSFGFYTGTQWTHEQGQSEAYNGTLTVCNAADKGAEFSLPPNLDIFFYGTDIFMYGTLTAGVAMNYTIDETTERPAVFSSSAKVGQPGAAIWSLTGLSTTAYHNLQLFPSAGELTIDYFTYTPTTLTNLIASDLVLDDQNAALKYSSGWKSTTDTVFATGVPYRGTTTGTNTTGSTMKFSFAGSSISVYGALQQVDGRLSASFSVDGAAATTYAPFNGTQTSTSSWLVSQQFFHQDLAPGTHSLLVTLDDVSGSQTLWIDSVVFEGTSGTTITNAGSSSASASLPGTTSSSNGLLPNSSGSSFHFPTPAIGGIVGGLVLLSVISALLRRRVVANRPPVTTTMTSTTVVSNITTTGFHAPASRLQPPPSQPPMAPNMPPPMQFPQQHNVNNTWGSPTPAFPTPRPEPPFASLSQPVHIPPWRPPMRPSPSDSSQWDSASSNVSSHPSSSTGLLRTNEKGATTLQWGPTPSVRNPSSHSDGWTPGPQNQDFDGLAPSFPTSGMDGRSSEPQDGLDGRFTALPGGLDGRSTAPQMDGRTSRAQEANIASHAHEDGRDDDVGPDVREVDASPVGAPPAYSDSPYRS